MEMSSSTYFDEIIQDDSKWWDNNSSIGNEDFSDDCDSDSDRDNDYTGMSVQLRRLIRARRKLPELNESDGRLLKSGSALDKSKSFLIVSSATDVFSHLSQTPQTYVQKLEIVFNSDSTQKLITPQVPLPLERAIEKSTSVDLFPPLQEVSRRPPILSRHSRSTARGRGGNVDVFYSEDNDLVEASNQPTDNGDGVNIPWSSMSVEEYKSHLETQGHSSPSAGRPELGKTEEYLTAAWQPSAILTPYKLSREHLVDEFDKFKERQSMLGSISDKIRSPPSLQLGGISKSPTKPLQRSYDYDPTLAVPNPSSDMSAFRAGQAADELKRRGKYFAGSEADIRESSSVGGSPQLSPALQHSVSLRRASFMLQPSPDTLARILSRELPSINSCASRRGSVMSTTSSSHSNLLTELGHAKEDVSVLRGIDNDDGLLLPDIEKSLRRASRLISFTLPALRFGASMTEDGSSLRTEKASTSAPILNRATVYPSIKSMEVNNLADFYWKESLVEGNEDEDDDDDDDDCFDRRGDIEAQLKLNFEDNSTRSFDGDDSLADFFDAAYQVQEASTEAKDQDSCNVGTLGGGLASHDSYSVAAMRVADEALQTRSTHAHCSATPQNIRRRRSSSVFSNRSLTHSLSFVNSSKLTKKTFTQVRSQHEQNLIDASAESCNPIVYSPQPTLISNTTIDGDMGLRPQRLVLSTNRLPPQNMALWQKSNSLDHSTYFDPPAAALASASPDVNQQSTAYVGLEAAGSCPPESSATAYDWTTHAYRAETAGIEELAAITKQMDAMLSNGSPFQVENREKSARDVLAGVVRNRQYNKRTET